MNEQLLTLGLGFVLGAAAKQIVKLWTEKKPQIEAALDSVDEKIEAHFGIDIPDAMQASWHSIVHGAVAYVNKFASDGRFWREVIRAIVTRDPAKAVLLQKELAGLTWESGIAAVEAAMSPELKTVVNEVKENLAVKVAKANALSSGAAPAIANEPEKVETEIRAAVRVVAPAHKTIEGPVTKDVIERLIRESQDRQAKLGGAK